MVCLISLAAGLHKYIRKFILEYENLDKHTENDVFGLFYSVVAHSLCGNADFMALITSRMNHPEFNNFLQRPPDRAPWKSESKEVRMILLLFDTLLLISKKEGSQYIIFYFAGTF